MHQLRKNREEVMEMALDTRKDLFPLGEG
jgi:hypothetical protein